MSKYIPITDDSHCDDCSRSSTALAAPHFHSLMQALALKAVSAATPISQSTLYDQGYLLNEN